MYRKFLERNTSGYVDPTANEAISNVMRENKYGLNIRRGEIWYIKDDGRSVGTEQQNERPAIVVSNNGANKFSNTIEVVFLTTKAKASLPTHTTVTALIKSTALCEQITSVSIERLGGYIRTCTSTEMSKVDKCLLISLGLEKKGGRE